MAESSTTEKTPTPADDVRGAPTNVGASGKPVPKVDGGSFAEEDDQEDAGNTLKVSSVTTPLLIEEIEGENVPASYSLVLEAVYTSSRSAPSTYNTLTKHDIIVLFVYVIMLEQGFVPIDCADEFGVGNTLAFDKLRVHDLCSRIPSTWRRSKALYEYVFILGPFSQEQCRVLCTICMDDLLINCTVKGVEKGTYSMLIDPSQYVIESRYTMAKRYQHVRQFAMKFKDIIANPAKLDILQLNHVQTPSLQHLPPELKMELEKLVKVHFFETL